MSLSSVEEKALNKLLDWEEQTFNVDMTDLSSTYDKWVSQTFDLLSPSIKSKVLKVFDSTIFQLNAVLQSSHYQKEARETLLREGQVFLAEINQIEDMKHLPLNHLNYIAEKQITRHQWLSLAQGGMTGSGGVLLLSIDLPVLLAINLRSIQLIAMTYGYDINIPLEMVIVLKVLHVGTLPARLKTYAWQELQKDILQVNHDPFFYEGRDDLQDDAWFEHLLRQIGKSFLITQMKKKLINGVPLLGIAFGAGLNYRYTKSVTDMAHRFYQKRYLLEKKGDDYGDSFA